MAGYSFFKLTRSKASKKNNQVEEEKTSSTFTTGYLYSNYEITEYAPEKVMMKNEYIAAQEVKTSDTLFNDCLTLGVNQTLRYPFFTKRE